ncbi:MAG: cytidylate kinase-like family protein [Proteobacteria bacterium]|nr:cytidylate kinase-like family protein [Pseudomonadota bacterium]
MPIITISQDSYRYGEEIAKKVAEKLGYECIGPEMIQHACDCLALPLSKMERALRDSPTFFERISSKKEQYLAIFRVVFFEYMCHDNIVYHGFAGHIFLENVPNVVKVRVIADLEDRISEEMYLEDLTYNEARKKLIREDKERAKWTKYLYGRDNHDPHLYDLYLNLHNISLDTAVAIIVGTSQLATNGHMEMMKKKLMDMALAAKTEARLLEVFPEVEAIARDGEVFVKVKGSIVQEDMIAERARKLVSEIEGVSSARIGVVPSNHVPF